MNRYIIPILLVILSASVYVFVIDAIYSDIQIQQRKEAELAGYLADAKTAHEKLSQIEDNYKKFPSGATQSLLTMLPDKVDPVKYIIDVDTVAQLHGLTVKSPQTSIDDVGFGSKSTERYRKNTLAFTVSAPYSVFYDFLRDMESSLALRDFSDVSFSTQKGAFEGKSVSPERAVYDYQVTIISYSLGS